MFTFYRYITHRRMPVHGAETRSPERLRLVTGPRTWLADFVTNMVTWPARRRHVSVTIMAVADRQYCYRYITHRNRTSLWMDTLHHPPFPVDGHVTSPTGYSLHHPPK